MCQRKVYGLESFKYLFYADLNNFKCREMSLVITEGNSPLLTNVKSLSWSCDLFNPKALQQVPG